MFFTVNDIVNNEVVLLNSRNIINIPCPLKGDKVIIEYCEPEGNRSYKVKESFEHLCAVLGVN